MEGTHIRNCSNDRAQNTHNAIPPNCNPISSSSVRTWQYLRRVGVQRPIVDVETEVDDTSEYDVLCGSAHLRVREEERHSD